MNRIKYVLAVLFIIVAGNCNAQKNILNLKHLPFYKESSIFSRDPIYTLTQEVTYNKPGTVDEEYSYDVKFVFMNGSEAKLKKVLDLSMDTAIVKSYFSFNSVWNWLDPEDFNFVGTIEILDWQKNKITLKEDFFITTRNKPKLKYKGIRTFLQKKKN
jgi:hypothetical protein